MALRPPMPQSGLSRGTPIAGPAAPSLPGLQIGPEIGRSADSSVYRATRQGVDYAVKILDTAPVDRGQALVRFRREAALLAGVADPRLPAVHEVGHVDGRPYLVMDLVDGLPLTTLLQQGPLDPGRVVRLFLDIVGALARMHAVGVLHRDLKPHNIMVLDDGSGRLIDFGLAAHEQSTRTDLLATPLLVGTLSYASPEQAGTLRRPVDHRSDLYSLGVVMFECLTGVPPFATADVGELLRRHATEPAPDPRSLVPVGAGLAATVNRLLAKDPDDRYQCASTLAEHLGRLAADPSADLDPDPDADTEDPRHAVTTAPARHPARLCGRTTERTALAGYWEQARAGRTASCVISGPTGIGSTRLAAEIGELARHEGAVVIELGCRDGDPLPFGSLRAAVEEWLGEVDSLPTGCRTAQHERIRAAAADDGGLLALLSPRLGVVLGTTGTTGPDRQDEFVAAAARFLAELARSGSGMLVLIDDAPLLDPGSERVLTRLVDKAERAPLLVLATVCTDRADWSSAGPRLRWLREQADAELDLQPLEDDGVAELVADRLPGVDAGSGLARLLALRCQGNPLLTVEYLRAVVDAGLLGPQWGRWTLDVDGLNALELPADAMGLVAARIDRLDDTDRRLLTIGAVIGSSFHPEVLADVGGVDVDYATTALTFAAAEQVVGTDDHAGGEYHFLHAQIRTALLDAVGETERAALHHVVAETLERRYHARPPTANEPTELVLAIASHYLAADPPCPDERVRAMWRLAGRHALAGHAPAQAITFLGPAVDAGPADTELLLLLATAYVREGRFAEARSRLDDALVAERDPTRRAQVLLVAAEVERDRWNREQAGSATRQGLVELGGALPGRRAAQALGAVLRLVLGLLIVLCGRGGTARGAERSRAAVTCELHRTAGYLAVINGQPELQLLHTLYAVPSLCRLGSGAEYALGVGSAGVVCQILRLTRLSERLLRRAEAAAEPVGDPQLTAMVEWYRAVSAYLSGVDDGERWQQSVERNAQWYHAGQLCDAIATFVWEAAALGDIAEARSWYERSHRLVARSDWASTPLPISSVLVTTGEGRAVDAATELDRIDGAPGGPPAPGLKVIMLMARTYALVEQGEFGRPFDEVVDEFTAVGPKPTQMIRQYRIFLVHLALGRLAQLRAADERGDAAAVTTARAAARRAVRDLGRTATAPNEKAFAELARADLALLDGQPERALRILGDIRPVRQVAPIFEFERARGTGRALAAAGYPVPARSQARTAMLVAAEAGLSRRAHAVAREFGLDQSGTGSSGSARRMAGSGSSSIDTLRLEALQEISMAVSTVLDPVEVARLCLDRTLRILSGERAVLFLMPDADLATATGRPLVSYLGRDNHGRDVSRLTGYSASLVERVRTTGELIVVTGTEEGAALGAQSVVLHGLRSIMVAPLQLEGRMLGVVYLDSQIARGIFTEQDAGILSALTTHIATALQTARAAELEVSVRTAQRQRDLADALRTRLEEMAAALEPNEVLTMLAAAVPSTLSGVDAVLVPEGAPELDDAELRDLLDQRRVATGRGPAPRTLGGRLPTEGAWSIHPLVAADRPVGLLVLHARSEEALSRTELDLAGVLIGQAMTAYERARLFSRVQELAVMDELTGVANRRRFFEVAERDLAAAQLHGRPMHAMMIDIDHFKRVNDTYGHPVGDEVIRAVAQRLRNQTRETDILGRYGGEEFAIAFSDVAVSAEFAERLRSAVGSSPVLTSTGPLPITVSIGLAACHSSDTALADVLARADAALYQAKRGGRNRVAVAP